MPGKSLTRTQTVLGWLYLPVYVYFLAAAIRPVFALLGIGQTALNVNVAYFAVNALFVLLVFGSFLRQRFFGAGLWNFLQALIVGLVAHYAGTFALARLFLLLDGSFSVLNDRAVQSLYEVGRLPMLLFGVLCVPLTEEVLVRGVVFGSIYPRSRFLAYALSALFFSFLHVWQFALTQPLQAVLLNAAFYLPSGLALAWVYRKSHTIWAPILMHALINAVSFGVLSLSV